MLVEVSPILISVAFAATPDVSWFPAALTPGNVISALPLNDTPPIFLAVSNIVADPALPVAFPVTSPLSAPAKFVTVRVLELGL